MRGAKKGSGAVTGGPGGLCYRRLRGERPRPRVGSEFMVVDKSGKGPAKISDSDWFALQQEAMTYALSLRPILIEEIRRLAQLGASCCDLATEYDMDPNVIKYLTKYPLLFDALPRG